MTLWLFAALLSAVARSLTPLIDKLILRSKRIEPMSLSMFRMFVNFTILLLVSLAFFRFDLTGVPWGLVLLVSFLFAAAAATYFTALNEGDISKLIPFRDFVNVVLSFLAAMLVLNERVTAFDFFGVFAIVLGMYVVLGGKLVLDARRSEGLLVIGASGAFLALYGVASKLVVTVHPVLLATIMYFFVALWLLAWSALRGNKLNGINTIIKSRKKLIGVTLASLTAVVSTVSLFFALSMGAAAEVLPVSSTAPVFTVLLGWLFLRERYGPQRLLGTLLLFAGVALIYL